MGLTLSESRSCRLSTFCALYVAQGIPWGFMLISLPAYLASEFQLDDTEIGNLKAIILIPWSFKLIWAPIMDNFTNSHNLLTHTYNLLNTHALNRKHKG